MWAEPLRHDTLQSWPKQIVEKTNFRIGRERPDAPLALRAELNAGASCELSAIKLTVWWQTLRADTIQSIVLLDCGNAISVS